MADLPTSDPDYSNSLASELAAVRQQIETSQTENNNPGFRDTLSAMGKGLVTGFAKEIPILGPAIGALVTTEQQKQDKLNNSFGNLQKFQEIYKATQDLKDEPARKQALLIKQQRDDLKAQYEAANLPIEHELKLQQLAQQKINFDSAVDEHIAKNYKTAEINQSDVLSRNGFTDAEIKDYNSSPIGQSGIAFDSTVRQYLSAKDPITRAAVEKSAAQLGYTITNQNGKDYISGNSMNNTELNDANFRQIYPAIMQKRAAELVARKQFKNNESNMTGSINNQITLGLMDANPEEYKGQYDKAGKAAEDFVKTNGFTPIEYRTNKLTTLLDQLKDGSLPPAKRDELLQQAQILGKEKGYTGFQASDGTLMSYDLDGKTPITLDALNERLKKDDRIRSATTGLLDTVNKQNIANRANAAVVAEAATLDKNLPAKMDVKNPDAVRYLSDAMTIFKENATDLSKGQELANQYLLANGWKKENLPDFIGDLGTQQKVSELDSSIAKQRIFANQLARIAPKNNPEMPNKWTRQEQSDALINMAEMPPSEKAARKDLTFMEKIKREKSLPDRPQYNKAIDDLSVMQDKKNSLMAEIAAKKKTESETADKVKAGRDAYAKLFAKGR